MDISVAIFNFQDAPVRTVMVDGQPWWVAKDVCDVLGLANNRDALSSLDEDEKNTVGISDGTPGNPNMAIINESGLYSLILKSRKKEAKTFKRWVTSEVLPSIRKTGSFSVREPLNEIDRFAGMMNQVIPVISGRLTEIAAAVETNAERLAAVEERQKEIDPQVIDAYRVKLHECKKLLVTGTKGKPQPVSYDGFWRELKDHCKVGSFDIRNQAALTVPLMEKAFAYAQEWCRTRGLRVPDLLDDQAS